MSSATANPDGDDDLRSRPQQSMLASQRAKQDSKSTEPNKSRKSGGYFPLGYRDAYTQWWANIPAAKAEHAVLSYIPFLKTAPTQTQTGTLPPSETPLTTSVPSTDENSSFTAKTLSDIDPHGPRQWHSQLVKLKGKDRALNEFSVERLGEETDQNLVMLHGYGAGLGFFYKNFEGLSRVAGWKVYALDLLGMGRSSRPPFKLHGKNRQENIAEAENWFIDALEEWRIQKKIHRFTLFGHSLGGYMAVAYALKYPGHLKKLVLCSPVGIPEDPYAVNAALPQKIESSIEREVAEDQGESTKEAGDNNNFLNAKSKSEQSTSSGSQPPRKPLPKWLTYLWDANISPFSLVRWSGPFGPRFVSGWTSRRFSHLDPGEAQALHNYAYSLFKLRGSGEYALAYVLAPGAFARSPLIRRIAGVGRQYVKPDASLSSTVADQTKVQEHGFPVILMYGENDWMDISGGYAAEQKLNEERLKLLSTATSEAKKAENGSAKVLVIGKAGHHVYLDGWEEFNQVMRKEMEDVSNQDEGS